MRPVVGTASEVAEVLLKRACRALRSAGTADRGPVQRPAPLDRPAQRPWASVSFCTTRAGLEIVAASSKYRGVAGLAEFITGLPGKCVAWQGVGTPPA
jgi:hypothetical protein